MPQVGESVSTGKGRVSGGASAVALRTDFGQATGRSVAHGRDTLQKALDVLGRPLVMFSASCVMLSRTRSLLELLESEPGRDALVQSARDLAQRSLAHAAASGKRTEWEPGAGTSLCPHRRTYTLKPYMIPAGVLCEARGVVVAIERGGRRDAAVELSALSGFGFTKRQRQVAQLLLSHYSTSEIAEALTISSHTARHHVEQVYRKAEVSGRRELRQRLASRGGGGE